MEVAKLGIVIVAVMRATKRSRVFFMVVNILGLNNKKSENFTFSLSGVFGVTSNVRISEVHAIIREHFSTYSFITLKSPNFIDRKN